MLTEQQHLLRRSGIGGSDAAAICGLSQWKTPLDVYHEKLGIQSFEEPKPFLEIRSELEPVVAKLYEKRTGNVCILEPTMLRHPKYPWMIANIDRRIEGQRVILECKTASQYTKDKWGEDGSDEMPDEYLIQCAHYRLVDDAIRVDLSVLIGLDETRTYHYQKNEILEENLIEQEEDFWHKNVLAGVPPEPRTIEDILRLYPTLNEAKSITANAYIITLFKQLKEAKEKNKYYEEEEKRLKTEIGIFMKDATLLVDEKGKTLATWKLQHKKSYTVQPSSTRVFRIKGE